MSFEMFLLLMGSRCILALETKTLGPGPTVMNFTLVTYLRFLAVNKVDKSADFT
jgi:hypothetical protein